MSPSKFRSIVNDEKKLLTDLCEKWEKVLTIEDKQEADGAQATHEDGPPSSRTRSKTQPGSSVDEDANTGDGDASSSAATATAHSNEPQQAASSTVMIEDEELVGLVRATTGQGRMLLGQRFVQFEKLIDDAENKTSEKPIRDDDLQGFWDMIGFQVDDMKEKFQVLEQAEANDWKLPEPKTKEPKPAPKPKVSKPTSTSTTTTTTSSRTKKAGPSGGMKEFIAQKRREAAAARKRQQEEAAAAGK